MIYKLSSAAKKFEIEKEFGLQFKYPRLYTPNPILDGFKESNLCVVTMEDKKRISLAIWGLMPQDFKEDWLIFQQNANTLNVQLQDLENTDWMKESFDKRRCLIIVSGFYTHLLKNGNTHNYYLQQPSQKPFYLAGVYNVLNDGFICAAPITSRTSNFVSSYHDISNLAPLIIPKNQAEIWLSHKTRKESIREIIKKPADVKLKATHLSNDYFLDNHVSELFQQPFFT